jgi:GT2 family glycosyltransferase
MMIKSELIKKIGLLDESLSPFFQEDVEYSFRAWKYGWKVVYAGISSVVHLQSYSFERGKIQDKKLYLALRNSLIVSKKYFGIWKSLCIGLPIVSLTAIFERKDKTRSFSLRNLKIRDKPFSKVLILSKAIKRMLRTVP